MNLHPLVRWSAVCMFVMIGAASLRAVIAIYLFEPIDILPGLDTWNLLLLTAVCWGSALAIAFGRRKKPPCAAL
jgi:hypothetical protein